MFRKLKRIDCNYKFFLVVYPLQYLSSFESYGVSALRFDCTLTWLQFWPLEFFLVCLVYSVLLLCNVVQYNLDYPNTDYLHDAGLTLDFKDENFLRSVLALL